MGTIQSWRNKIILFLANIQLSIKQNIMLDKFKELLTSRRFWMLTLTAALELVKLENPELASVLSIVQTWLLGITAVGTMDSFASRAAGKK